jgi:DNA-binding XRE family transcriptional regulator
VVLVRGLRRLKALLVSGISSARRSFTNVGHKRNRPKRLAEKLRRIRESLRLSLTDFAAQLDPGIRASDVSRYENDQREPPIIVVLAYARLGRVTMEQIIDDEEDLSL